MSRLCRRPARKRASCLSGALYVACFAYVVCGIVGAAARDAPPRPSMTMMNRPYWTSQWIYMGLIMASWLHGFKDCLGMVALYGGVSFGRRFHAVAFHCSHRLLYNPSITIHHRLGHLQLTFTAGRASSREQSAERTHQPGQCSPALQRSETTWRHAPTNPRYPLAQRVQAPLSLAAGPTHLSTLLTLSILSVPCVVY
ncbi:hypothetical protein B0J11DRAFT_220509 [Dendryphion nanum]|uniref:Uncharacterized protein n=1 Tax=Dendryphion nanum TaxID=256645 RepID=A0A9P9ITW7_9PLEO|nr:hypothetical protein B0J11DRAFT_220509 [Dendryphion nanum]